MVKLKDIPVLGDNCGAVSTVNVTCSDLPLIFAAYTTMFNCLLAPSLLRFQTVAPFVEFVTKPSLAQTSAT